MAASECQPPALIICVTWMLLACACTHHSRHVLGVVDKDESVRGERLLVCDIYWT